MKTSAVPAQIATNLNPVADELRDIKPPVPIPGGWLWLWWGLVFLWLLAVVFILWLAWRHRFFTPPIITVLPPHARARKRLDEALALLGEPKPFCIAVSDAVRQYLEDRFRFRAPERTTEEFLHELSQTDLLSPEQKARLTEFLERCDLVKFARYEPREAELHDLHAAALRLVEETEPKLAAPAPPPPDTNRNPEQVPA